VITADGVEIAVGSLGAFGGAGVVMAHATGFCAEVLRPLALALGPGYWPVGFDARGHGGSGRPPKGVAGWKRWDWHNFGLDVLAVADWMAAKGGSQPGGSAGGQGAGGSLPGRPFGFGHSCGGTALLMAELARPGTFEAIYAFEPVVFRPAPTDVGDQSSPLAEAARRRREVFSSAAEAYAKLAHKGPFAAFDSAALAAYLECGFEELADGGVRLACRREDEAFIYEAGLAHDAWDHLGELSCPVTVAFGTRSEFMGEPDAAALASRMGWAGQGQAGRGQVERVEAVGHLGPMEQPGAIAVSVLRAFGAVRDRGIPVS
jgi:pimeloyl-ACP methyl ester carboxylesterase